MITEIMDLDKIANSVSCTYSIA